MGRKVCPSNWLLEVGRTAGLATITITITITITTTTSPTQADKDRGQPT